MSRSRAMEALRAELLAWVADRVAQEVCEFGVAADVAEQIGNATADALADDWGGQVISVPKDHFFRLAARDYQVLDAHAGGEPIAAIALRMHITARGVRKILKRAALRDPTPAQPGLFD